MAAILRILLLTLVLCHGVDAKAAKRKKASKPKTSGESSSRTSSYDWGNLMTVVQQVFADWKFDATFESLYNSTVESLYNFTNSSTSTEGGLVEQLVEKLRELWESNLQDRIIAPCDRWYNENQNLTKTRHELVATAKADKCTWNALTGAMSGAIPVPGLDAVGSVGAGFLLQAQGACIVAKLRGYDVQDEKTQSLILWALGGEGASEVMKGVVQVAAKTGGTAAGKTVLSKVPNQFFKEVNKKMWPLIGRHLVTKGPQGLLSLSKIIPVMGSTVGAVAGGAIDWFFCHKAIDFADQKVFRMINREEEDLRAWLLANEFEEEVDTLMAAQLDTQTVCHAEKSDLQDLGLSLGRVLKLRAKLFEKDGLCTKDHAEL